jgi:predicted transcriptional regulator
VRYASSEANALKLRDKLSIYIPQERQKQLLVDRLLQISKRKDRSINYLVVQAIMEFIEREERKKDKS